jgi:flagellar biosynthesis protein FlhA
MTDVATSADRSDGPLRFSRLADLGALFKRSDIGLAVGVMAILVVLILPLPSLLLDFALAISITFSVLILMTALFIQAPLEFSAFPTVLLIATMLRLALNLASTRLILSRGHEGTDADALLPLVNASGNGDRLTERIKALRRSLATEMGFVMPSVRILDNVQLDANSYVIKIKEVESGSGKVWYGQFMVMDPTGKQVTLPGVHTSEPTFGLPATWIEASLKEEASVKGYTVVDSATVLATHLTELIKANMSELLSYGEVQKLLKELPKEQSELIKDIVPSQITISGIQRVLQILLAERVSIRDLSTILEGIADGLPSTRNPTTLAEHVRGRLSRQLCAQHTSHSGHLPIIALTAHWEQVFAESIVGQGDERNLAIQPSKLTEFINLVRERFEVAAREGDAPVLVTSAAIRPFVRGIIERFRAQTSVLAQSEIHPRARLRTNGQHLMRVGVNHRQCEITSAGL